MPTKQDMQEWRERVGALGWEERIAHLESLLEKAEAVAAGQMSLFDPQPLDSQTIAEAQRRVEQIKEAIKYARRHRIPPGGWPK